MKNIPDKIKGRVRDRVKYVPAGLESWPGRVGQIFVKKEKNKKASIRRGSGYRIIKTLDKTIHMIHESARKHRLIDTDIDCDYMVPYQNPAELAGRIDLGLVNPVHASKDFDNIFRPHGVDIISDSGGFQMLQGVSDFVHPDGIIKFYNKHTDIGMPLDLPMRKSCEPLFFDAVSRLMKANDEYMLPKLNDNVTLAVVSHGSNVTMRAKRLEAIYRPTPVLAIAGLNTLADESVNKQLVALSNAMYVISQTRETTEYYHFLGVTSRFWFIIYAILAGTGYVKTCGGDSVSHRMAAITGAYKHRFAHRNIVTNSISIEKFSHKAVSTSCGCPICGAVGDLNLLAEFTLCESHLIWYSQQEKNLICDSVEAFLEGRLTVLQLCTQWLQPGQVSLLTRAIDYIDSVIGKGYKELSLDQGSLTGNSYSQPPEPEVAKQYTTILKNYEKFHKKKFLKKQVSTNTKRKRK